VLEILRTVRNAMTAEYTMLMDGTGFRNTRVSPTVGPMSVVESVAA
jgi:hypothetical protein